MEETTFTVTLEPGSSEAIKLILRELEKAEQQLRSLPGVIQATKSMLTTVATGLVKDKGCPIPIKETTLYDFVLRPDGKFDIVVTQPKE